MQRKIQFKLLVATFLVVVLSTCSIATSPVDREFEDVGLAEQPLLTKGCSLSGTLMTLTVKDGESAFLWLRPSDSMVVANGNVFNGSTETSTPCQISSTATVQINADTTGATFALGRSVVLDYINGLFLLGETTPAIKIDFTLAGDSGALNTLKIRGSEWIDNFSIGAGTGSGAAAIHALNVNAKTGVPSTQVGGTGGGTVNLDASVDVTFKNVSRAVLVAGPGDDRLDGSGGAGTGNPYPNPLKLFGGDGLDTLTGGLGADRLSGGANADTLSGCAGDDVYDMGAVAAGADIIAVACPSTTLQGNDTVDYSARTGNLSVNLSRTLSATNPAGDTGGLSGEASGDGAHISDKVVNIKLGAGDDTLVIGAASTLVHNVTGGPGDDSFTGGLAVDVFDGQAGDDTCSGALSVMDYRLRTTPVSVSSCAAGCGTTALTDANDGELATTRTGSGASTVAPGTGINVITLTGSGFAPASVGNTITLSGCTDPNENGPFQIVKFVSATEVKVDVGASTGFASATDTCNYSELRPNAAPNPGTGTAAATLTIKHATGSVTGLNHASHWLGHILTLTHTTGPATSDGSYAVLKALGASSVAIDETAVGTFAGGIGELDWSSAGPEHDNVQCGQVLGGSGNDLLVGDGRANILRGGAGNDTLVGGAGSDLLYGEAGADAVYGGVGSDTVIGGGGTGTDLGDSVVGGDGNDTVRGDAASDVFECDGKNSNTATSPGMAPGDADLATDFTPGVDTGAGGSATALDCD